jgi:hypothetical protein
LEDLTINRDPTAHPGPEDDAKHGATPRRCTVGCLGQGKAIGVVRYTYRPAQRRCEIGIKRAAVEAGRICVLDETRGRRNRTRHRDADRGGPTNLAVD